MSTLTNRLATIGAYETARLDELAHNMPGTETSAEVAAERNLITARTHLMRLATRLSEHYPNVATLDADVVDDDHDELTGMSMLCTPNAYDQDGQPVTLDATLVPEAEQWVYGVDDGGADAWDGFYTAGDNGEWERVNVATILAAVDALDAPDEEHIILVAFEVNAHSRRQAHTRLMEHLGSPDHVSVGAWWVAEDDRRDGSDNDSAVFVHPGMKGPALALLAKHRMAHAPILDGPQRCPRDATATIDADGVCDAHGADCVDLLIAVRAG